MPRTDVVSAAGAAGDNKPAEAGGDAAKSGVKRVRKVAGPGSTGGGDAKGE
jgi:hypothetical protein